MAFVALAVVCAAGYRAYLTMPQAEDPGFTIRTAIVVTHLPGANPQRVEDLVTDKVEKAVQELPELDSVQSKSATGVSVVTVNVKEEYFDMRPIWDSLRRKIDKVGPELPSGVRGPFVNDEFGDTLGTVIAITGEGYSYAELKEIAYTVRDMLLRLDDTGRIEVHGVQDERVFVEFDAARLAELGVSVRQLQQQLQAQNILIPGGNVSTGVERIELEPSGSFESIEDLASTVIRTGEQGLMYLEDIARVSRGYREPPQALMRANGRPAVGLAVATKSAGNIVRHGQEIQDVLTHLRAEYPVGVELSVVAFQSEIVERKVDEFVKNVLQAIGLVLVAMLIMLGPRTGLVVASLIPFAMLMSLAVMDQLGIGLNQMSLAALIIVLGMLVDNAIVMSESIMVEMAAGKKAVEAAVSSAGELRIPLLTSSLTTSAAFLPIFLAESTVGEYTNQLFTVVTIAPAFFLDPVADDRAPALRGLPQGQAVSRCQRPEWPTLPRLPRRAGPGAAIPVRHDCRRDRDLLHRPPGLCLRPEHLLPAVRQADLHHRDRGPQRHGDRAHRGDRGSPGSVHSRGADGRRGAGRRRRHLVHLRRAGRPALYAELWPRAVASRIRILNRQHHIRLGHSCLAAATARLPVGIVPRSPRNGRAARQRTDRQVSDRGPPHGRRIRGTLRNRGRAKGPAAGGARSAWDRRRLGQPD